MLRPVRQPYALDRRHAADDASAEPDSLAHSALDSARRRLVGRATELAILRRAIRADGARPLLLVLHGAEGTGKTALALLAHLTAVVERRPSTFVPAAQIEPTPAAIRDALVELGLTDGLATIGRGEVRDVLIVDAFEHIARASAWLFAELLACAGANLTVIVTSRRALGYDLAPYATMVEIVERELGPLDADVPTRTRRPVDPADVRRALTAYHVPHELERSSLAAVFERDGRVEACRAWIRDAIAELARSPAHADLAAVLRATYIEPSVKQRAAAADLKLPWGTYRHRLRRAVDILTAELRRTAH